MREAIKIRNEGKELNPSTDSKKVVDRLISFCGIKSLCNASHLFLIRALRDLCAVSPDYVEKRLKQFHSHDANSPDKVGTYFHIAFELLKNNYISCSTISYSCDILSDLYQETHSKELQFLLAVSKHPEGVHLLKDSSYLLVSKLPEIRSFEAKNNYPDNESIETIFEIIEQLIIHEQISDEFIDGVAALIDSPEPQNQKDGERLIALFLTNKDRLSMSFTEKFISKIDNSHMSEETKRNLKKQF